MTLRAPLWLWRRRMRRLFRRDPDAFYGSLTLAHHAACAAEAIRQDVTCIKAPDRAQLLADLDRVGWQYLPLAALEDELCPPTTQKVPVL
jgi:hypothetical protein